MERINSFDQFLNEKIKWDSLSTTTTGSIIKHWVKDLNAGKKSSTYTDSISSPVEVDIHATISFKGKGFEVLDSTGADGRAWDDKKNKSIDPIIIVDFRVEKDWLPSYWQDIYMILADVMRHEIEHITQDGKAIGNYRKGKPNEDDQFTRMLIKQDMLPKYTYLLLKKEIDANLQGLRYSSKKRKESMADSVNRYLDMQPYLTDETRDEVMTAWRKRAKKIGGIPSF